jgi:hypothetical protein
MDPLTEGACDRLVVLGIVRRILGYEGLDSVAGIRAAVEKGWHGLSALDGHLKEAPRY